VRRRSGRGRRPPRSRRRSGRRGGGPRASGSPLLEGEAPRRARADRLATGPEVVNRVRGRGARGPRSPRAPRPTVGEAGPDRVCLDPAAGAGAEPDVAVAPLGPRRLERLPEDRLVLHRRERLGAEEDVRDGTTTTAGPEAGAEEAAGAVGAGTTAPAGHTARRTEGTGPRKDGARNGGHRAHNRRMSDPVSRRDLLSVTGTLAASALLPGFAAAAPPAAAARRARRSP
jgi:hypothetical protein